MRPAADDNGVVTALERRRFRVAGVVQGVGFRPFVYGLARRHGLAGFVLNDGEGVVVEVEGEPAAIESFAAALRDEAPPLARLARIDAELVPARGEVEFAIAASAPGGGGCALVPPDV